VIVFAGTRNGVMNKLFRHWIRITENGRSIPAEATLLYPALRRVRSLGQTSEKREKGIRLTNKQPHGGQKL
jgi:hypothetical protein